ncbi:hypothetical protein DPMN_125595 [Dreissena polymorpha]|uniref:Secreted protein n=1 Tax=Dreissena polymorpha TaxID=45954 RepID=A0A9D4JXC3_DREPO|nr:hypothetical protein DPMN_125595 [Dreissena polymorpha]
MGVSCWCSGSLCIVANCLRVPCRCPDGLGEFIEPSGSLLQVPRRSGRPSGTVWESPAGTKTVLASLPTVCGSLAGAPEVWKTVCTVWDSLAGAKTVLAPS